MKTFSLVPPQQASSQSQHEAGTPQQSHEAGTPAWRIGDSVWVADPQDGYVAGFVSETEPQIVVEQSSASSRSSASGLTRRPSGSRTYEVGAKRLRIFPRERSDEDETNLLSRRRSSAGGVGGSSSSSSSSFAAAGSGRNMIGGFATSLSKSSSASNEGKNDCTSLTYLDEANILENLRVRYVSDQIYTFTGAVLFAVNPYKPVYLDTERKRLEYKNLSNIHSRPPHPYALADLAYRQLVCDKESQAMVISGESGAGKTETAKIVMKFLGERSRTEQSQAASLQEKILSAANPLLESFGNATTIRNGNSSRFGKYNNLCFNAVGSLVGAEVRTYLLEASRVIKSCEKERTYHVFHEFFAGCADLSDFFIDENRTYKLLQTSARARPDADNYRVLLQGLEFLQIEPTRDVFNLLAAIIHLGECSFEENQPDGVGDLKLGIPNRQHFDFACAVGGFEDQKLIESCTRTATFIKKGFTRSTQSMCLKWFSKEQANGALQSLMKILYSRLFDWVVEKVNVALNIGTETSKNYIGILDIYGFEQLEVNSLEQLCINLANERLQQFFVEKVLVAEQHMYRSEGLQWTDIALPDAGPVLGDISHVITVLEQSNQERAKGMQNAVNTAFTDRVHQAKRRNVKLPFVGKKARRKVPMARNEGFVIGHYAGEVEYDTTNWIEKNETRLRPAMEQVIKESTNPLVAALADEEACNLADHSMQTIGKKYVANLEDLMNTLNECSLHYIRCFKPNDAQKPGEWSGQIVLDQMVQSGTIELVRVMHDGFPNRCNFQDLADRFLPLLPQEFANLDARMFAEALMIAFEVPQAEWTVGITRLFLKAGRMAVLEALRASGASAGQDVVAKLRAHVWRKKLKRCLHVISFTLYMTKLMRNVRKGRLLKGLASAARNYVRLIRWLHRARFFLKEKRKSSLQRKIFSTLRVARGLDAWLCRVRVRMNARWLLHYLWRMLLLHVHGRRYIIYKLRPRLQTAARRRQRAEGNLTFVFRVSILKAYIRNLMGERREVARERLRQREEAEAERLEKARLEKERVAREAEEVRRLEEARLVEQERQDRERREEEERERERLLLKAEEKRRHEQARIEEAEQARLEEEKQARLEEEQARIERERLLAEENARNEEALAQKEKKEAELQQKKISRTSSSSNRAGEDPQEPAIWDEGEAEADEGAQLEVAQKRRSSAAFIARRTSIVKTMRFFSTIVRVKLLLIQRRKKRATNTNTMGGGCLVVQTPNLSVIEGFSPLDKQHDQGCYSPIALDDVELPALPGEDLQRILQKVERTSSGSTGRGEILGGGIKQSTFGDEHLHATTAMEDELGPPRIDIEDESPLVGHLGVGWTDNRTCPTLKRFGPPGTLDNLQQLQGASKESDGHGGAGGAGHQEQVDRFGGGAGGGGGSSSSSTGAFHRNQEDDVDRDSRKRNHDGQHPLPHPGAPFSQHLHVGKAKASSSTSRMAPKTRGRGGKVHARGNLYDKYANKAKESQYQRDAAQHQFLAGEYNFHNTNTGSSRGQHLAGGGTGVESSRSRSNSQQRSRIPGPSWNNTSVSSKNLKSYQPPSRINHYHGGGQNQRPRSQSLERRARSGSVERARSGSRPRAGSGSNYDVGGKNFLGGEPSSSMTRGTSSTRIVGHGIGGSAGFGGTAPARARSRSASAERAPRGQHNQNDDSFQASRRVAESSRNRSASVPRSRGPSAERSISRGRNQRGPSPSSSSSTTRRNDVLANYQHSNQDHDRPLFRAVSPSTRVQLGRSELPLSSRGGSGTPKRMSGPEQALHCDLLTRGVSPSRRPGGASGSSASLSSAGGSNSANAHENGANIKYTNTSGTTTNARGRDGDLFLRDTNSTGRVGAASTFSSTSASNMPAAGAPSSFGRGPNFTTSNSNNTGTAHRNRGAQTRPQSPRNGATTAQHLQKGSPSFSQPHQHSNVNRTAASSSSSNKNNMNLMSTTKHQGKDARPRAGPTTQGALNSSFSRGGSGSGNPNADNSFSRRPSSPKARFTRQVSPRIDTGLRRPANIFKPSEGSGSHAPAGLRSSQQHRGYMNKLDFQQEGVGGQTQRRSSQDSLRSRSNSRERGSAQAANQQTNDGRQLHTGGVRTLQAFAPGQQPPKLGYHVDHNHYSSGSGAATTGGRDAAAGVVGDIDYRDQQDRSRSRSLSQSRMRAISDENFDSRPPGEDRLRPSAAGSEGLVRDKPTVLQDVTAGFNSPVNKRNNTSGKPPNIRGSLGKPPRASGDQQVEGNYTGELRGRGDDLPSKLRQPQLRSQSRSRTSGNRTSAE
ncbi:unnamed protein product [Amoebophrya sp. A25]|nr:unnamed protein product [Amoebophrya sp. A25]|eukprot:GSA25T00014888001.1